MKKRIAMIAAAAALTGTLLIGGTLAYLTSAPEQKVNTFTVGAGLTGELKEPLFDGENFTETQNQVTFEEGKELGNVLANNFVPGRIISKDPAVANTSGELNDAGERVGTPAWVIVKLKYTTGGDNAEPLTLAAIEQFATIDWNNAGAWEFNDDKTVAYYTDALPAGAKTETLFNTVTINADATSTEMQSFEILIDAYLVQKEGFANAKEAMAKTFEK